MIYAIKDTKSPGLDGYTGAFFKKSWEVIKGDFVDAIQEFFREATMYEDWNKSSITLIPKMKIGDYRPIACCLVFYKVISKILSTRLQKVICSVVDEAQAGFIPERVISDNVQLAAEIIKVYNCKHNEAKCMIKMDLWKAYDSIEWSFLEDMMAELGFPQLYIDWVMACVSSVSFQILVNGKPDRLIKAKKG